MAFLSNANIFNTAVRSSKPTGKAGTVIIKDRGWNRIVRELKEMDGSYTKVGFPQEGEVKSKRSVGSGHEEYTSISEIALIASWLQFGTKNIDPGWPFFTEAFDESIDELILIRDRLYVKVVSGTISTKMALAVMGEFMVKKVKTKIVSMKSPPNAPATIRAKKGADNPLIDTGQLLNSVQHTEFIR